VVLSIANVDGEDHAVNDGDEHPCFGTRRFWATPGHALMLGRPSPIYVTADGPKVAPASCSTSSEAEV
jgi:hypothetical protein